MVDSKIARICWNSNFWVSPSGNVGKSTDKESYEFMTGFGHEEWNFDTSKVVDGYVYGFLQQFNNKTSIHAGQTYNIYFYSIENVNSNKNKKWWIGNIKSVEVISKTLSKKIYSVYKKHGWIAAMEGDLRKLKLKLKPFRDTKSDTFFNVRFKVDSMNLLDEPVEIKKTDRSISAYYYNLLPITKKPILTRGSGQRFKFKSGHNPGKKRTTIKSKGGMYEKSLFHNEIQTKIFSILEEKFKKGNVGTENNLGYQTKVDIVVKQKEDYFFYEIKTCQTAKYAIREAMGQILEYAYWPNYNNAVKLVIIAPPPATTEARQYIKSLRDKFNIPIYYQAYNVNQNRLSSEI